MPTAQASRRLSPKVRSLLHEHRLQARAVAGTGTDGRVTTHDVLGAVAVRHGAAGGEVRASPLARRARAAVERTDEPAPAAAHHPTAIVATEAAAQEERLERATLGLLTISDATPRRVTSVDHLGQEVVHTRPHVTVRLHHADRATSDHATALLEELRGAIASWTLPVGR